MYKLNYKHKLVVGILTLLMVLITSVNITNGFTSQEIELADSKKEEVLSVESIDLMNQEDNPPVDPVVADDPKVTEEASRIDSLSSNIALANLKKPNIVVIMLDDVNPHDGRLWRESRTPAIYNNIISKGINFTNFYVETPLCCPARANFLTGQHTHNHKVIDLDGTRFNPLVTLATKLRSNGYHTMLTGKYLNYYDKIKSNIIPPGWDRFDSIYESNGQYYNYRIISKNGNIKHYGTQASDYSTDVIANIAVSRLKNVPSEKPIFAYISPYAVHGPNTPAPRHIGDSRCRYIEPWKVASTGEADVSDKPTYVRNFNGRFPDGYNLKTSCETMLSVDDLVRRVRKELIAQGRLNNTIFILTADNGMGWGEHRYWAKTTPYSTHVPFYLAWPLGRGTSSRIESTILSNIDFAPTICALAGCVMNGYPNNQNRADGVSFLGLIKDGEFNSNRDAVLESQPRAPWNTSSDAKRPAWWAIRTTHNNLLGLWHYVEYETGEKELYDVSNGPCFRWTPDKSGDPCELENLLRSDRSPSPEALAVSQVLAQRLSQLKAEKGYTPPPSPTPTLSPTIEPTPTPTSVPTVMPSITPTPTI